MIKSELSKKSLHELRILGRKVGVKSVSTLKKQALIDNIIDIANGIKQPSFNNFGRKPYVSTSDNVSITEEKLYLIERLLDKTKNEILEILKG